MDTALQALPSMVGWKLSVQRYKPGSLAIVWLRCAAKARFFLHFCRANEVLHVGNWPVVYGDRLSA